MGVDQNHPEKVEICLTLKEYPGPEQIYIVSGERKPAMQPLGIRKECSHFGTPWKSMKGRYEWPDTQYIDL